MSIFKKKKKPLSEVIDMEVFPEVIKESVLKPTKCGGCHSIYQAKPKHIKGDPFQSLARKTMCPICNYYNAVEFEEDEE